MMGGWTTRKRDLIKAMKTATFTCQAENELLAHILRQQRIVLDDLQALDDKMKEIKKQGGGVADLRKEDVDSFSQKMLDIADTQQQLAKTSQCSFNPQVKEYLKVHNDDFDQHQVYERDKLEKEKEKPEEERQEHKIIEYEANLAAIDGARDTFREFSDVFLQRNRICVRNEGYFLHARNNVLLTAKEAKDFVGKFEGASDGLFSGWCDWK
eukprot:TRINITY_DN12689_c0_g1_i1.p1 TRINITY_DN12689_c0_g1~~TRINITY_DN12689_c0_g1_i1.p1  ORF type:complete len:211 (+),score=76.89 TRINITY_DN12689_c0_g1_i1:105-737(+)